MGGVSLPAIPGADQPRNDTNTLRGSDSAPLAQNHTARFATQTSLTQGLLSGRNDGLHTVRRSGSPGSLDVALADRSLTEQWPSSALAKAPQILRRFLAHLLNTVLSIESKILCRVETLARSVDLAGNLVSFRGRIRLAGQAEAGILPEDLPTLGPSLHSAARRGPPSCFFPSEPHNFLPDVRLLRPPYSSVMRRA